MTHAIGGNLFIRLTGDDRGGEIVVITQSYKILFLMQIKEKKAMTYSVCYAG